MELGSCLVAVVCRTRRNYCIEAINGNGTNHSRSRRYPGGNEDFRQDSVLIGSDLCRCHLLPRCNSFAAFGIRLQPNKSQAPSVRMILGCFGIAGESCVRELKRSTAVVRLKLPK